MLICHTNAFLKLYVKLGREDHMLQWSWGYANSSVDTGRVTQAKEDSSEKADKECPTTKE